MTIPNSISSAVLARYFSGTATAEELASVEAWIGDDAARQAAVAEWRAVWQADIERLGTAYDNEAAWARLSERVGLLTLVRDEAVRPHGRSIHGARGVQLTPEAAPVSRRARAARWAAAAAVIFVAGAGMWRIGKPPMRRDAAAVERVRDYTTPRGQRGLVRLSDGTEVMLNVASRLRVPTTFGASGAPRALELEGEAYFTVVHDANRPFTVRTAHGVYRDVGTRFNVSSYPESPAERIIVTEGEVAVRGKSDAVEIPLLKGQAATVTSSGRAIPTPHVDAGEALAWTQGRLQLDGVTLAEAARRVGRWYGLDVRVADDRLAQRRVVGSYSSEPVAQVLGIVAAAVGARYEMHGQSVTFFPRDVR